MKQSDGEPTLQDVSDIVAQFGALDDGLTRRAKTCDENERKLGRERCFFFSRCFRNQACLLIGASCSGVCRHRCKIDVAFGPRTLPDAGLAPAQSET